MLEFSGYKKRIADKLLNDKINSKGAVLIEGPKWCGKTTTAEHASKSMLYISNPVKVKQYQAIAELNPESLLEGDTPRLIDEWQLIPSLFDTARFMIDHRKAFGQFIFTGSSVPVDTSDILHTGTGRFTYLKMRPMSLYESLESNGSVSLASVFENNDAKGVSNLSIEDIAFLTCRGGWPIASYLKGKSALSQAIDYYESIVYSDMSRIDNVKRDSEKVRRLLASYSRNQASQASIETILLDMKEDPSDILDARTVSSYIDALKRMFVIEDSKAWNPNLRSKTAIRSSDTRYFVDPSIAAASLGIGPQDLLNDMNTFGLLFETLAIRDLRVYADALDGTVYHYRDKNNLECDAVIHLRDGRYGLIEIKLGGDSLIEKASEDLKKLASIIDIEKMKKPSFLMVLTAIGEYAYKRKDGVLVVPIGCLKN